MGVEGVGIFAAASMMARRGRWDDNGLSRSGDEEEFAGSLAGFQVAMGVCGVGEGVNVF
jgi:hypothetical protein